MSAPVEIRHVEDWLGRGPGVVATAEAEHRPGQPLWKYLRSLGPIDLDSGALMVIHNGRQLHGADLVRVIPRAGDEIVVTNPPGVTAAIVNAGLFALIGWQLVPAAAAVVAFVLNIGIAVGISYAIAALTSKNAPRVRVPAGVEEETPTRSFAGVQNTFGPRVPVPLVYGRLKLGGHILASFQQPRINLLDETSEGVNTVERTAETEQDAVALHTRIGLCKGPIQSVDFVEIDGNPIGNIRGVQWEWLEGTPWQKVPDGFAEEVSSQAIASLVSTSGGPITAQTKDRVTRFQVELVFPSGLTAFGAAGDRRTAEVEVKIEYKRSDEGSYTTLAQTVISGATSAPKVWWAESPLLPWHVYDVRVSRITTDTSDPLITDAFQYQTLQGVVGGGRNFAGLAQLAIRHIPGEQSRLPQEYACEVRGFRDIRVYSSLTSYEVGWSDVRAWCCAHWLTTRHGASLPWERIHLQSFLDWAEWENELVEDGRGGKERRGQLGLAIDSRLNGQDVLELFGTAAGVNVVEEGGIYRAVIDRPGKKVMVFGAHNIKSGTLTNPSIPAALRAASCEGVFFDEETDFSAQPVKLDDDTAAVARFDIPPLQLDTTGITRRGEAMRLFERQLLRQKYSKKLCDFEATIEAIGVRLGDIFGLAHPDLSNCIASGHILAVAADAKSFEIDEYVELTPQTDYFVVVCHRHDGEFTQKKLVSVTAAPTATLSVQNGVWARTLQAGDSYAILAADLELYRTIEITRTAALEARIRGELYDERIYVTTTPTLPSEAALEGIERAKLAPGLVRELALGFAAIKNAAGNVIRRVIRVDWQLPLTGWVGSYDVWWRPWTAAGTSVWRRAGTTAAVSFEISSDVEQSTTYEVAVVALTPGGARLSIEDAAKATVTTAADP